MTTTISTSPLLSQYLYADVVLVADHSQKYVGVRNLEVENPCLIQECGSQLLASAVN